MAVPTREEIDILEQRLLTAMMHSDCGELDALLAEELVFTDHLGAVWGKQDDLAAHRSGAIRVATVMASDERIHLLDGAAIVNVRLDITGTFGGQPASGVFRFTRVWVYMPDRRWQVVAGQSTLMAGVYR
jgi:hypothetical protein